MATVEQSLLAILVLLSAIAGVLAAHLLFMFRRLGTASMPPFQYNPATLHDFELLSATESLLLFGGFVGITAGITELHTLKVAAYVPLIIFTLLLVLLLERWRRRYG